MQNHIINYNCDIDSIEELNGYTIEHAEGCTDASAEGFSITAYREISGVKVYREFSRNDGVYYISGEYIPDMEKETNEGVITMRRKIEEYIEDVNKTKDVDGKTKRDWMFGAIDFCLSAKLINTDTYEDLLTENDLI